MKVEKQLDEGTYLQSGIGFGLPSLAQSQLRSIICVLQMAAGVQDYTVAREQSRYRIPP